MITAREALALPGAQVSESDAAAAREIVEEIDAHVRAKMTRLGVTITFDPRRFNQVIMSEVARAIRRAGWQGEGREIVEKGKLTGQPVVTGLRFFITPSDAAYDTLDEGAKEST